MSDLAFISFMTSPPASPSRWNAILVRLAPFVGGQLGVQAITFLTGFLLLRWLSVPDYAQFGLVFSFQSLFGGLVDLGLSGAIVALCGKDAARREVVGAYVRAASELRARSFWLLVGLAALSWAFVTRNQGWSAASKVALFGSVVAAVYFQGWSTLYSAPLVLEGRMKAVYSAAIFSATLRFGACFVLHRAGILNGEILSWLGALMVGWNGWKYRQAARDLLELPPKARPETRRELSLYLQPQIPVLLFYAFQGQVAILLITIFGSTRSLAEVAALIRLGQLFLLLETANTMLVAPLISRASDANFPRLYARILGGVLLIVGLLIPAGWVFSGPLLWFLGPQYANLRPEVGWIVLTSCMHYVASSLWTMHSARKMVDKMSSVIYISLTVAFQVGAVLAFDLGTTHGAVLLLVATYSGLAVSNVLIGILGWKRLAKQAKNQETPPLNASQI